MSATDIEKGSMKLQELEHPASDQPSFTWTPEEEKKLVRKIDLFILPTLWIMYVLSYVDRTNIGNAKIAGMEEDLDLSSNEYSIALVVFFVTYVTLEPPSNMILARWKPSLYLPLLMTIWGALTCCMAAIDSFHKLVGLRILVGVFESGFAPGVILIISSWYRKTEQSKRFAIYISGAVISGAFGGLLAGAITSGLEGACGIRGWRWLFIVEGAASIFWAICSAFILLDFPANTKRLSERERAIAIARLQEQNVAVKTADAPKVGKGAGFWMAVKDWRTWPLVVGYMVIVGSSTLSYFYPTLAKGLGYTNSTKAQYMTVPIYGVAFVCVCITGYVSDKLANWRGLIIAGWLTVALITSIVVCTVYDYTVRYAMLVIMAAGLWSSNGLAISYGSVTLGDLEPEIRGIALAIINGMGNLASIYGAYLFPSDDKPKYLMGFGTISGLLALGVVTYTLMHFALKRVKPEVLVQDRSGH